MRKGALLHRLQEGMAWQRCGRTLMACYDRRSLRTDHLQSTAVGVAHKFQLAPETLQLAARSYSGEVGGGNVLTHLWSCLPVTYAAGSTRQLSRG
jgi:hypothetical protein